MKQFFEAFGRSMRSVIGFSITMLVFAFLFALMVTKVPPENKELMYMAAGLVLGSFKDITNYYFGTSKDRSDQQKAEIGIAKTEKGS